SRKDVMLAGAAVTMQRNIMPFSSAAPMGVVRPEQTSLACVAVVTKVGVIGVLFAGDLTAPHAASVATQSMSGMTSVWMRRRICSSPF
ncbi:MAG TPA: hypothetical protein VKQ30_12875, partial [Ktedonobacterales bacterium]|nr:hypothetical protein [Ktedonobacterales bacterium]